MSLGFGWIRPATILKKWLKQINIGVVVYSPIPEVKHYPCNIHTHLHIHTHMHTYTINLKQLHRPVKGRKKSKIAHIKRATLDDPLPLKQNTSITSTCLCDIGRVSESLSQSCDPCKQHYEQIFERHITL